MELYKDRNQPVEKRVEDLLSRMTLEEKAAQLCGNLPSSVVADGKVVKEKLKTDFPYGFGTVYPVFVSGTGGSGADRGHFQ